MLIVMRPDGTSADLDAVLRHLECHGLAGSARTVSGCHVVAVDLPAGVPAPGAIDALPGVERVVLLRPRHPRAARGARPERTVVEVGGARVGGGGVTVLAGPCAVEGEDALEALAVRLRDAGADVLRGGAFKPRSSPYAFQGLGVRGLEILGRVGRRVGLPVVTEAIDEASLEAAAEHADLVQIGARNMQNYALLKRAGRIPRPVLLKRGMSATLEDLLLSAEYVLDAGNPRVVLCERGIRTFSDHSRYTLDLAIVPAVHERSHLPILVDPSHATGLRARVVPMALAAAAAGADGVLLEVHPDPPSALSDARQAIVPEEFAALTEVLRSLAALRATSREALT